MNIRRMIMKNKGQTAMEYLMTYGWAILIVIVVVAALFAMGVFKIGAGVKCSPCFSAGGDFTFIDHNGADLSLKVGPRDIVIAGVSYPATQTFTLTSGVQTYATAGQTSGCDTSTTWSGDCTISLTYIVTETTLTHTSTATLHQ
jgi:hypothetical protein